MSLVYGNCYSIFKFSSAIPSKSKKQPKFSISTISHPSFFFPLTLDFINRKNKISLQSTLDNQSQASIVSVEPPLISASDVVRKFYDGINRHDLLSVEPLIADNCVYEDLIFPSPFLGRKSILEFFGKFIDYVSTDLQFVIDAISEEDSLAVGVTWHLEWKGRPFPFSKGCSFYQLAVVNDTRQIIYARDSVEPAIKPGESALRSSISSQNKEDIVT